MKPLPKLTPTTTPLAKVPGVGHHTAAHTPLPWKIAEHPNGFKLEITANDGLVCHVACTVAGTSASQSETRANAQLIVQAVNNHDALVEVIKALTILTIEPCFDCDGSGRQLNNSKDACTACGGTGERCGEPLPQDIRAAKACLEKAMRK